MEVIVKRWEMEKKQEKWVDEKENLEDEGWEDDLQLECCLFILYRLEIFNGKGCDVVSAIVHW